MFDSDGKPLPLCLYSMQHLNEPLLPYEILSNNTILLISISLILIQDLFLGNAFLLIPVSPVIKTLDSIYILKKIYQ